MVGLDGPLAGKIKIKSNSVQLDWKLTELANFSIEWCNIRNKFFSIKLNKSFKLDFRTKKGVEILFSLIFC